MISLIAELYNNHKLRITIDEEYTPDRYDFLDKEGIISIPAVEKRIIYNREYSAMLSEISNLYRDSRNMSLSVELKKKLDRFRDNRLNEDDKKELKARCKRVSLKAYFDKLYKPPFDLTKMDTKK